MPRKVISALVLLCLVSTVLGQSSAPQILGFSADRASNQIGLESRFDTSLKAENLREWMKRLTARPHHLGSAYNKENADFIAAQFRSWG